MRMRHAESGARSAERGGFTLLEVTLAVSIGLVLLWGLYVAMDVQLSQANIGRDIIEHGKIARSMFRSITTDINSNLTAVDPRVLLAATPTDAAATPTDGSTPPTNGSSTANASATPTDGSTTPATETPVTFNVGVQGGPDWLMLTSGRDPQRELSKGELTSDLRRITYFFLEEGGLARYETKRVTASDLPATPEEIPDPYSWVKYPEVTSVSFEYFDGSGWVSSWSGTDPGEDGETPIGPPAAIAITVNIMRGQPNADGQVQTVSYRHVVVIPAANSLIPPAEMTP